MKNYFALILFLLFAVSACKKDTAANTTLVAAPKLGNGYLAEYDLPAGDTVQSFSTTWIVPNAPITTANPVQVMFLWDAIESQDGNTFMQPVLKWTGAPGVTGGIWQIEQAWYQNGQYLNGTSIQVKAGDKITGRITLVSHKDTTYTYKMSFVGYPQIDQVLKYPAPCVLAQECFEPYIDSAQSNNLLPASPSVKMTGMNLLIQGNKNPANPTWYIRPDGNRVTASGKNSVVVNNSSSNGEIDFYFR